MHNPTTPKLPDPLLQAHSEMIDASLQPLVDKLSRVTPFISAGLFVKDNFYEHEASAASIVNTPNAQPECLEFTENSIRGHRVDLTSTVLGKTFDSHESILEVSKLNPKHHLTWGAYAEPKTDNAAVLQLVFDRQHSAEIDEKTINAIVRPQLKNIWHASSLLINETTKNTSLADELLLDVPVTPNAYVIKWDILNSTKMVIADYPLFRHYLERFELAAMDIVAKYDGHITAFEGDSQNIAINLPHIIDKSDLRSIGKFGHEVALPLAHNLLILHHNIANRYPKFAPKIRIVMGLGYIEQLHTNEITGPVFWEIASLLRSRSDKEFSLNRAAKFVLDLSKPSKI